MGKIVMLLDRERNLVLKRRIAWCLAIGWILLIFSLSSDPAEVSREKSTAVLEVVEEVVEVMERRGMMDGLQINNLHRFLRKQAHVFLYFTLTLFLIAALHFTNLGSKRKYLYAFFVALVCASLDELYQSFIPGRSGEVMDVFIDGIGVMLAIVLCKGIEAIYRRKSKDNQHKSL